MSTNTTYFHREVFLLNWDETSLRRNNHRNNDTKAMLGCGNVETLTDLCQIIKILKTYLTDAIFITVKGNILSS